MIKESIEKIKWLLEQEISSYEIARQTNVTRQLIDKYRLEPESVSRMSMLNGIRLEKYAEELKMKKTYLNDIMGDHFFDVNDLSGAWSKDEGGWFTLEDDEREWFEELNCALDVIEDNELDTNNANQYEDLIEIAKNWQFDDKDVQMRAIKEGDIRKDV